MPWLNFRLRIQAHTCGSVGTGEALRSHRAVPALLETYSSWYPDRPLVLGYLSQLLARLNQSEPAQALADRYHALTGKPWVEVRD